MAWLPDDFVHPLRLDVGWRYAPVLVAPGPVSRPERDQNEAGQDLPRLSVA
jgi:hypothetical protein